MNTKIKILHLEDSLSDAELADYELHKGNLVFEKRVVDNREEYEKMLSDFNPDIILSDHSLPSFNSFKALAILKERKLDIPFILVTATMSEEFAVDIMKQGADDYILKDRMQRLPSAVANSIEKHRLADTQKAAHERLIFHIENTPLGFIEWDHRGFAKSWSKRTEEIFGWSEKEFIETQVSKFNPVYEEDIPWVNKIFDQLISGEVERNKIQYRNTTKDGRVIWCEWFNSILKDADGKVKTIMSLVQDVTEQKELEGQKDNFLSMASHELKTPVTTIKAYAQLAEGLLRKKGDVDTLDLVKRMVSQVNRLTVLIESLLDFTKIQKGKLMYDEDFFDFNEVVSEVIDDMQKTSKTHTIKNNSGENGSLFGDKNKISQVLNNLISNAIKYSPNADNIIISTQLQKDGIELSVRDFGIGISEKSQENIFQQFYRVTGTKESTYPGMGIGLYICSEIIARLRGKIWVESIINKGSTFYIWLPYDHRNK
ncbi:MAG: ATP-binding protein [Ginsengibacter sp.]